MSANSNPYLALGVRPFINCCSVRTMHGGSLMLPQVREAMAAASRWFVNLDELMEAAGRRLAELTGAEWGIVTCGSAAAVALGTAACVAGNDPVKMLRLPFTEGMVNRVIIPRTQRFAYDQAVRMIGCHIVEIDTREELDRALEEPVAMVVLLGKQEHLCPVRLEEFAAIMKPRGIPIMVDAASEHLERPSPWLARGADLVIYSGGKFLRGPQTSGLLLGSKRLVEAAWRNASPHQALGRPMKVSKEDIIGVLAAVEYWFEERDRGAERQKWYDDLAIIAERIGRMPGCRAARSSSRRASTWCRGCASSGTARSTRSTGLGLRQRAARRRAADHARRQLGDRQCDRDRPVPAAAGRSGGGRRGDRRRSGRLAPKCVRTGPSGAARNRRRMGDARRFSARRPHPSAQHRAARRRARRPPALGRVRGAGQRRAARQAVRLSFSAPTRAARSPICSTARSGAGG